MSDLDVHRNKLKLSWGAVTFIEKPSSWVLSLAVGSLAGSIFICVVLSFFLKIEVNVIATGEIDSLKGVKQAVSLLAGDVTDFTLESGAEVKRDQVIAHIRVADLDDTKLNQLLSTLREKKASVLAAKFTKADAQFDYPPMTDLELNTSCNEVSKKLATYYFAISEWSVRTASETAPIRRRLSILNGQLKFVNSSKVSRLLEMQRQSLEEERGRLKQQLSMSENTLAQKVFEARLEVGRSIDSAASTIVAFKKRHEIIAPVSGKLAKTVFGNGSAVKMGDTVAFILPDDSPMIAKVFVPTRDVLKVKAENEVRLAIDAFPPHRFGYFSGKILSIEKVKDVMATTESGYMARVSIDTEAFARTPAFVASESEGIRLVPGMKVEARIVAKKASLMTLFLDKILGKSI